uniref:Uncharacterized protein n=1 Tax=Lygus hesperus TaxID=30085 RepID=A0A0A9Y7Y3_LYGHE
MHNTKILYILAMCHMHLEHDEEALQMFTKVYELLGAQLGKMESRWTGGANTQLETVCLCNNNLYNMLNNPVHKPKVSPVSTMSIDDICRRATCNGVCNTVQARHDLYDNRKHTAETC